jgi:hypothetical protein
MQDEGFKKYFPKVWANIRPSSKTFGRKKLQKVSFLKDYSARSIL